MSDFKKKIKEDGRRYFASKTPDLDFKGKLDFKQTSTPTPTPKRRWQPLVWLTSSVTMTLAASLAIGAFILSTEAPERNPLDFGLAQVRDADELRDLIQSTNDWRGNGGLEGDFNDTPTNSTDQESPSATSHSETNVQVEGVDEGDIIKTDGDRIYKINYNRLQVIDVLSDGNMELLLDQSLNSENESSNYTYFSDIYLSDDYLVVLGQRYTYFTYESQEGEATNDIWYGWYWGVPQTVVLLYDLLTLEIASEIEINGYLLSSRRIDDRLYVISNHYPVMREEDDDPRPVFRLDDEVIVPSFSDIKYLDDMPTETFTIVTTVFLDEIALDFDIFLGASSWGQVYVSHQAIYLATYIWFYDIITQNYRSTGLLMSYIFEEDGTVAYGGAAEYKGYVINQFAIDEYDGYIRMVTTEWLWLSDGREIVNRLYVFEREITPEARGYRLVSLLDEGLGKPGETVQSVRFNGTTATVVTYEQTDPFYTIDLSDPADPIIRAGLEISGFSTYQHLWGTDYIIGIGFEAEGNNIQGLKLTMFDISDLDNPVVVGEPLVMLNSENGWQYSEALYNHKALLSVPELDILGFSIARYFYTDYNYYYFNDYFVFDIDPEAAQPITIATTISHGQYLIDLSTGEDYWGYFYSVSVERAVTIDTHLFAVSNLAVTSHDINDGYAKTAHLDLLIEAIPNYIL